MEIKPSTLDRPHSWDTYLVQFEAEAANNGWDEATNATALVVNLRGTVMDVRKSVLSEDHNREQRLFITSEKFTIGKRVRYNSHTMYP